MDVIKMNGEEKLLVSFPLIAGVVFAVVYWYDDIFVDRNFFIGEMWIVLGVALATSLAGVIVIRWNNGTMIASIAEGLLVYGGITWLLGYSLKHQYITQMTYDLGIFFVIVGAIPVCLIEGASLRGGNDD